MNTKPIAIFLIIFLVIILILFALKIIQPMMFWIILAVIGLIAYKGLPWLRKQQK